MSLYCGACQSMVPDLGHLCKVNSMHVLHTCTYLGHVDGEKLRAVEKERDILKSDLKCQVDYTGKLMLEVDALQTRVKEMEDIQAFDNKNVLDLTIENARLRKVVDAARTAEKVMAAQEAPADEWDAVVWQLQGALHELGENGEMTVEQTKKHSEAMNSFFEKKE